MIASRCACCHCLLAAVFALVVVALVVDIVSCQPAARPYSRRRPSAKLPQLGGRLCQISAACLLRP